MYTPYSPPAAPPQHHYDPTSSFRPLGGLTTAALVAVIASVPVHLATNVVVMTVAPGAEQLDGDPQAALGAAFVLLGAAALTIAVNLVAIILFLMWLHRAATNVRAFGHQGLEFTPGWCVGWWFVPFANLFKPLQVMKEVWRASDPDAVGTGDQHDQGWSWRASTVASTMGLWWGAWVVSGILDRVSGKIEEPALSGSIGIASALVSGLAALLLLPIMRQLAARQDASWAKLQSRYAQAAQYYGYRAA